MIMLRRGIAVAAACCALGATLPAQTRPAPPATPRIYIFDGGSIKGLNPSLFNFTREEIKEPDFVVVSYLIVHPRGTLMFDSGVIPDSAFKGDGAIVTQGA